MNTIPKRAGSRKLGGSLLPCFTAADAPPAAVNRTARRSWAAEANRALRHTGDPDAARRAGAKVLVAALDVDDIVYQSRRTAGVDAPVNLSIAANRRKRNIDGATDRAADVILAGVRP